MDPAALKHLLVPIDFYAAESESPIELAVTLARALGASLTLLHVYPAAGHMSEIVPGADSAAEFAAEREVIARGLDRIAIRLRARGVAEISTVVDHGHPIEAIVNRARTTRVDLIVMGTHGRSGVSRLLDGSVAEGVLRQAPCPVLTVHLPRSEE